MTPVTASLDRQQAILRQLMAAWVAQSGGVPSLPHSPSTARGAVASPPPVVGYRAEDVELLDVAVLVEGRPGLLDVVAAVAGCTAHAVLGLRRPGDEPHVLGAAEDLVLGTAEDAHGPALVVDAVHDARLAQLLLSAVCGPRVVDAGGTVTLAVSPAVGDGVALVDDDPDAMLTFDERTRMRVFSWLRPWPHPGVAFLLALDEAGFNHLQAPIAVWRREGRDLGIVQELFVGAAPGWAVALGSLRDVCASGFPPEQAGGDFAPEARALGTMVARMHRALDRAFGRRASDVATMAEEAGSAVAEVDAAALDDGEVAAALGALRAAALPAPAVRVHGDLHLGRTARCDQGWFLADCMPGGTDPATGAARYRSPLADVADLLWSLGHAASAAAADRAPLPDQPVLPGCGHDLQRCPRFLRWPVDHK